MSKAKQFDLTQGKILNKLLFVALPIMGTQLLQMAYNLTDMFWLGRVGSDAVAASGTAGMYLWLSQAFMMVGRMGSEIGVSQSLGRKDEKSARKFSQTALNLSVILGILFGVFMVLFRNPLIGFFKIADQAVASEAAVYLAITGAAIPATYITASITGTFNGAGNSRIPFYINAVGLVLNMILDPLLINVAQWGVAGAAIATSLAQVIVALLFLIAVKCGKQKPFHQYSFLIRLERGCVKQIFWWSIPIVLESMLFTFLSMVISRIVAGFGVTTMAVQRVGSQIESLSWLIGGGFASAVTAFMGQNYGAGKWSRVHKGISISMKVMAVWGALVTLVLFFQGRALYLLFLPDPESADMGTIYLQVLAACQVIACLEYNSAGVLRGIGKTIPPSFVSICGNILRIPIVYVLSRTSLGINGVWIGLTIGASIRSLWLVIWFIFIAKKLPHHDHENLKLNT